ncbi:MAG: hypothetical protein AB6733_07860 [Clostridiaceae bacterium]
MYDAKIVKKDENSLKGNCIADKGYFRSASNASIFNQKTNASNYTLKNF